jgi:hypothetical protein
MQSFFEILLQEVIRSRIRREIIIGVFSRENLCTR